MQAKLGERLARDVGREINTTKTKFIMLQNLLVEYVDSFCCIGSKKVTNDSTEIDSVKLQRHSDDYNPYGKAHKHRDELA